MNKGLVHLYYGKGKGKTTAACGLALRALGHGKKVTVVQFLKDGSSGEIKLLEELGAVIYRGKDVSLKKFPRELNEEEREAVRKRSGIILEEVRKSETDLLILDEVCAAVMRGLADEDVVKKVVSERPEGTEVVLTGREPAGWMLDAADYITRMECVRHPFEKGTASREGIEF